MAVPPAVEGGYPARDAEGGECNQVPFVRVSDQENVWMMEFPKSWMMPIHIVWDFVHLRDDRLGNVEERIRGPCR